MVSWSSQAGREHDPHPGLRMLQAMPRSRAGLNLKCMILNRSFYLLSVPKTGFSCQKTLLFAD